MKRAIAPEKIKGALRRIENLVATKPFRDATQNLIDNPDEHEMAEKDPKEYLSSFGVVVPDGFKIEIAREKTTEIKTAEVAPAAIGFVVKICISWCTLEGCHTYCIRFEL